jgi:hypothetical protein
MLVQQGHYSRGDKKKDEFTFNPHHPIIAHQQQEEEAYRMKEIAVQV